MPVDTINSHFTQAHIFMREEDQSDGIYLASYQHSTPTQEVILLKTVITSLVT